MREFENPHLSFDADGTFRTSDGSVPITANYRFDMTKTPHSLEIFDLKMPERTGATDNIPGIFEFAGSDQIKVEFAKAEPAPPTRFGEYADVMMRVGTPPATPSLIGEWMREVPIKETYTFKADGTVRSFYRHRDDPPRDKEYRYWIDGATSPRRIDFFFLEGSSDPAFRGIVEFEGDSRLKFEGKWTREEAERPKNFGNNAEVYRRAP